MTTRAAGFTLLVAFSAAGLYLLRSGRAGGGFGIWNPAAFQRAATDRWKAPHPAPPVRAPRPSPGSGRVWHVDGARGNDGNDGRSEATALRSLSRATGAAGPGDTVLVKAGRYRERVLVRRGGTAAQRLLIVAAGDGEVVLDASTAVRGWVRSTGGAYRARPGFAVTAVVVDGRPLIPQPRLAALAEGEWHYDPSGDLHVWAPGGVDPGGRELGVIADDESQFGIALEYAGYVTLHGLTVRYAGGHGIVAVGDHVHVENCTVEFNGKAGINLVNYGGTATTGARVVGNDIHWNVMRNWPRGRYKWGGWAMGAVSNANPDVVYEGNVSHDNGGEGLGAYGGPGGAIFRGNVVYDNWSVNIYVDNRPDTVVERNFVYCREPDLGDLRNNGDPVPGDNKNRRRLRAIGILTGDEDYSLVPPANLRNVLIANNLIVRCRRGVGHYAAVPGSGLRQVRILHNTIVLPDAAGFGEAYVGIGLPYNSGNNDGTVVRDNIVVARHPSTYLLYSEAPRPGTADTFKGLALGPNLWHHAGRASGFHWGPDGDGRHDYTHAEWEALPGNPSAHDDVVGDPGLVDPAGGRPEDLRPARASALSVDRAVDAGVRVDFTGAPRPVNGRFDFGAFEFRQGPPGPTN